MDNERNNLTPSSQESRTGRAIPDNTSSLLSIYSATNFMEGIAFRLAALHQLHTEHVARIKSKRRNSEDFCGDISR